MASLYQSRVVTTVGRERDHDLWLYFVQKEERKGKEKDDRPRSSNSWAQLSSLVPKDLLAHRLVQPELPIVSLVLCKKKNERDVSWVRSRKKRSERVWLASKAHQRSSIESLGTAVKRNEQRRSAVSRRKRDETRDSRSNKPSSSSGPSRDIPSRLPSHKATNAFPSGSLPFQESWPEELVPP